MRRRWLTGWTGWLAVGTVMVPLALVVPGAEAGSGPVAIDCVTPDVFGHWLVSAANAGGVNDSGDNFGGTVAVGDFNGDGFGDVAVGAPNDAVGGVRSGAVYVFPGSAAGIGTGIRLTQSQAAASNESGDAFGGALAAGDFNRDGRADLAVGAPGEAIGTAAGSGAVVVFAGTPSGLVSGSVKDQSPGADEAGDRFGTSLAVGDFNADTYPDLAVGTPGEAPGTNPAGGVVYLLNGSSSGVVAGGYRTQENAAGSTESGDRFGQSVAAGDVSGDGIADLVAGAPGEAPGADPAGGAISVLPGGAGGPGSGYTRTQANAGGSTEAGDNFGATIEVADFNGDRIADIAVGAPNEAPNSNPAGGAVYLFRGVAGSAPTGYYLTQAAGGGTTEAGDGFGAALGSADTDRDGFADLLVGAPSDRLGSGPRAGAVNLFGGGPRWIERARRFSEPAVGSGDEASDRFGAALASGDVTGDGRPDLVIGTPGEAIPGQPAAGTVTVVSGLSGAVSMGPLTGAVTDTTARIWARGARPGTLRAQYRVAGTPAWTTAAATATFDAALDHTAVVTVTGLAPATSYEYRLAVDCTADPLATGTLRTTAAPSGTGRIRFGYGADIANPPYAGYTNVASKNPDFFIYGGDNLYADAAPAATTTAQYNAKYRDQWGEAFFRQILSGVPSLMMWDDHEISNDWSSGQTGLYGQARPAFDAYQGSHNPPPRVAGTTYFSYRSGPADFYVMDTRTYRSPNSATDNASKTMLGATQKADLKAWLTSSTAPFKFLVSSVPWNNYSTTGSDSWRGFTTERGELFNFIRDNAIRGVVLISGDQHWAGTFRTSVSPYTFYEFMPTPIFVSNRPMPTDTGPDVLYKSDTHKVYAIFDVDATVSPARLTVEYFDTLSNASLYQLTITTTNILP